MSVPSGNYFIKNLATGYYVASQGHSKDTAGGSITTARPSMIVESSRAISFNVRIDDSGLCLIKANWSGAHVGSNSKVKDKAVWTVDEQPFKLVNVALGVYRISSVAEDRFWYEGVIKTGGSDRSVLLGSGKAVDNSYLWTFQAV